MKKAKIYQRVLSVVVAAALLISVASCQREMTAEDLMADVTAENVSEISVDEDFSVAYNKLALKLLKAMYNDSEGENVIVSPLAVMRAMLLLANAADSETLEQIDDFLNTGISLEYLNVYMRTYTQRLGNNDNAEVYLEESLWFNSDKNFSANADFLQTNANYYEFSMLLDSFSDSVVQNINNWMANETGENVDFVISDVPEEATAYMVNATTLLAKWSKQYSYDQVADGEFTAADGSTQSARMMTSYEYEYLNDGMVEGFIKYYSGETYALVVLRPGEYYYNLKSVVEYLNYERLADLIDKGKEEVVLATVPKFECDYAGELSDVLKAMGVTSVFSSSNADLQGMGEADENLYLDDIYSKTYFSVSEQGTSAGTAASISNTNDTATTVHEITLDEPFIFMVVDCTSYLPIMLGVLNTLE